MVQGYEKIINAWPTFSSVLSAPQTDDDLDRLIGFCDYLVDQIGGNEKHPLIGLLDIVGTLIEKYEDEHIAEPEGTPTGCLKYLMEEHGLRQKDLTELGSPGVISEILSGKRELNKRHIKALAKRFGCSPAVFI
ncbi:transcriptional regulator [Desulfonema ishimotonii]|uniref:Transcriptional regulator n=1 Tax=Desulfonema ishimotonii TaxID=45657 RepID=A0A401G315_9BACT|nr:helix-turn-helix domain-containing protein [Desulfonema ishimotonii]GBC63614.1 transcriptional regulator [Desulfonema ishimotonii]